MHHVSRRRRPRERGNRSQSMGGRPPGGGVQYCMRCGAAIPFEARLCLACGWLIPTTVTGYVDGAAAGSGTPRTMPPSSPPRQAGSVSPLLQSVSSPACGKPGNGSPNQGTMYGGSIHCDSPAGQGMPTYAGQASHFGVTGGLMPSHLGPGPFTGPAPGGLGGGLAVPYGVSTPAMIP